MFNFSSFENEKGITLVEIVATVFVITLLTVVLISDFPRSLRQLALSRTAYDFAQNLRKAQDLGLSGIQLLDANADPITTVKGYGIYIDLDNSKKRYVIYADVADSMGVSDSKYSGNLDYPPCGEVDQAGDGHPLYSDCITEIIDITKEDQTLSVDSFEDANGASYECVNFSPPGPTTTIENLSSTKTQIGINFKNGDGVTREVYINTSGLITVK